MIRLILRLALVGVIVWFIENYVPMPDAIKTLIRVLVVIFVVAFLLNAFGLMEMPIPKFR